MSLENKELDWDLVKNHPSYRFLKYFKYEHLPTDLAEMSKPFCELAHSMVRASVILEMDVAETMAGLRKLLEAKDCAVRALIKED
jgi:hypothetical protein